jgi:hypothetical protein
MDAVTRIEAVVSKTEQFARPAAGHVRLFKGTPLLSVRACRGCGGFGFARAAALDQRECAFAGDRSAGLSVFET